LLPESKALPETALAGPLEAQPQASLPLLEAQRGRAQAMLPLPSSA